ncbi:hypothetical protein EWM64_g7470 [Hericium alpestre]|uniref:CCHC-type domain-containing protein n=1 Tax=Hericium alpestre TaxID=135208 RepID=A0A4Y9ZRX2_9AGAM|nr:hypothetical protein EWM64_g7470 [Hericium alpestre]
MGSTATTSSLKILTVGSALGSIRELFAKVKGINAKHGKFDFVLCVGDFFGPVKEGEDGGDVADLLEAPLTCYIMQGELPLPQVVIDKFAKTGGEICLNVFLLSKSAVFTTAEGLRIACLGGIYEPSIFEGSELPHGFSSPYFTSQTVSKLLSNTVAKPGSAGSSLASIMSNASASSLVDIIISHTWPSSVTAFSSVPLPSPDLARAGAPPVDDVIRKIKPRYIFSSAGGAFWEREPFVWGDEEGRISRFIGLGAFGAEPSPGGKKQRPGHLLRDCPTTHQVGDTGGRKPREGYVCRACGSEAHYLDDCPVITERRQGAPERRRGPPKEIAPDECWFCLSNPALAKHLIVAIGEECYVTLPKGQLVPTHAREQHPDARLSNVPGGGHVLIVPIAHFTTLSSIPDDLRGSVEKEIQTIKTALRASYAKHGAVPIFFEVGRLSAKGGHAHIQVIPVPQSLADKVEQAFLDEGQRLGAEFTVEEPDAPVPGQEAGSYFRAELPDARRLVHWMREGVPFSVQFGRQVLAYLMRLEDRVDWKACMQSEEEDIADVQAFKTAFAPFSPLT